MTIQALAKVNLGLRVLYRRPDNFHELRTVFQTISLADRLELEYRRRGGPSVELTCDRADLAGPENLAAQAAQRLLELTGSKGRVRLHLEKRIPVGAGLGGGSSDAAAVLRALGALLRPAVPREALFRLAGELGSDVPFFLVGGRALGLGRGTEVYPLADAGERWLVVVAPGILVSTAEAYRRLSPNLTTDAWNDKIDRFCSSVCVTEQGPAGGLAQDLRAGLGNDFEPVVFRMHPELETLKARLKRCGARPALLCGSGSAVFGLFADRRQAVRAHDSLDLEDGQCFVVKTVSRASYDARWRKWLKGPQPAG
ncbi:MAG: 4-(cytidine 5'-diphospho)-2-C-methyl-D-erythritol kinase [Acidobacteria bacterium]|nr:4-(cytidine 5'-diphospho)-2-C-methyl-D-erythritol kinase [Acidobacteriota bacterium]